MPINELITLIQNKKWASTQRLLLKPPGIEATTLLDANGDLPLHHAINQLAPDNIITCILNANHNAIFHKNNDLWLPLHFVTFKGASSHIVELLIRGYPESLEERDSEGRTPRDLALEKKRQNSGEWTLHLKAVQALFKPTLFWMNINLEEALQTKEEQQLLIQQKMGQIAQLEDIAKDKETELNETKKMVKHFLIQNEHLRDQSQKYINDLLQINNALKFQLGNSKQNHGQTLLKRNWHIGSQSFDLPIMSNQTYEDFVSEDCKMVTPTKMNETVKFSLENKIDLDKIETIERRLDAIEARLFFS